MSLLLNGMFDLLTAFDGQGYAYPSMDYSALQEAIYNGPQKDYEHFQSDMSAAIDRVRFERQAF